MNAPNGNQRSAMKAACALVLLAAACAGNKNEARNPSGSSAVAGQHDAPATDSGERDATVQISAAFRKRCSLVEDTNDVARFDYDQASLRPRGRNVLDDVARCLTEGPLKGEVITIIGRADSRGSEQHNEDLGASRAAATRNYLAQRGVPTDQIRLMSRGEQGARGDDDRTMAVDRRVDIELGDLKNSPILQGSMMQSESSKSESSKKSDAASYSDTAEGGTQPGGSGKGTGSGSGTTGGTSR